MKRAGPSLILVVLALVPLLLGGCSPTPTAAAPPTPAFAPYFGQEPPGLTPEVFAAGILPPDGLVMHSAPAFSPDGSVVFFSAYDPGVQPRLDRILFLAWDGSQWSEPQVAPFSGTYPDNWPWFSPDGQRLYFTSERPLADGDVAADGLWAVERQSDGWSPARPITSPDDFRHDDSPVYVAANLPGGYGDLDIYRLVYELSSYSMPENLGPEVNTAAEEYAPCTGRGEVYLLFNRFEQAAGGSTVDLYVSFRQEDGSWTPAQNVGDIASDLREARFPGLSPDGQILFLIPSGGDTVLWVDAGWVEQFRPRR